MPERIDSLVYDGNKTALFFDGPTEFLCKQFATILLTEPSFKDLFGENIVPYKRMDWGIRNLPAIRVYNDKLTKQFESWFIEGDLTVDAIFPASLRRDETQQVQDTLSSALMQVLRSVWFFNQVAQKVPGLNELGKTYTVDKTLGFLWEENIVPLTQITVNFRIDLREWDLYLEETNRTKETPFVESIATLKRIKSVIDGWQETPTEEIQAEVELDQKI